MTQTQTIEHHPGYTGIYIGIKGDISFVINGRSVSKEDYLKSQKARLKKEIRVREAYVAYKLGWDMASKCVDGNRESINAICSIVEAGNTIEICRAAALGIYHKYNKETSVASYDEFLLFFDSLDSDFGGIYVMDSESDRQPYETYMATYLIHRLDNSSVFTIFTENDELNACLELALTDSSDERLGRPREAAHQGHTEGALSGFAAPLAATIGVAIASHLLKSKKTHKAKELAWINQ